MSKDDVGCKLTSVYKHKERKPKKPHYIPRPWGKPYNYKCFQCPFTCMEKSHLYNHMKYSLCKNSLSLLIESDWPYKKGNLLHPELRLLQASGSSRLRGRRDEQESSDPTATPGGSVRTKQGSGRDGHEDKVMSGVEILPVEGAGEEGGHFQEEEEDVAGLLREMDTGEKKGKNEEVSCQGDLTEPEVNTLVFGFKNKREKPCKEVEPDFIITDVFSLKNHVMKSREMASPDLDAKPKQCKVPKKCLASSGILMEQWKLVANGQRRNTPEVPPPCSDSNIIPCYPPPAYSDYHEPQGLNLSLLGINYPLNPSLFSYLSPTMTSSAAAHPHLAQLPFLASTAQLMHPHPPHFQSLQSPERSSSSSFLPRFYYPLLFEHTFGSTESKMSSSKPEAQPLVGSVMPTPPQAKPPSDPSKAGLLKVPVLKAGFPWSKGAREESASELSHPALLGQEEEEKWLSQEKGNNLALGLSNPRKKPTTDTYQNVVGMKDDTFVAPSSIQKTEVPVGNCLETSSPPSNSLKRKFNANGLDGIGSDRLMPGKLSYQGSGSRANPGQNPKALDHWHTEVLPGCPEEPERGNDTEVLPSVGADLDPFCKQGRPRETSATMPDSEATTMLIGDLSKTLEEYQEVEKKLSDLAQEDTPGQKELRDQLVKIRRELYHIHQALEKATKPHEGPLDLSVKRSSEGLEKVQQARKDPCNVSLGNEKLHDKDQGAHTKFTSAREAGDGEGLPSCLLEAENKTIDLLIKMSHSENLRASSSSSESHLGAVIKAELLPLSMPLELRHVMEPFYSRTTKCEADSSVLLCSDGRSSTTQGPQLPVSTEDGSLSCRAIQRSLSCSLPSETDPVCVHSPLHADP